MGWWGNVCGFGGRKGKEGKGDAEREKRIE